MPLYNNVTCIDISIKTLLIVIRLMCAKVFCVPTSYRISRVDRKTSEVNSTGDIRRCSTPLNVPALREEGVELSFSLDRGDSG